VAEPSVSKSYKAARKSLNSLAQQALTFLPQVPPNKMKLCQREVLGQQRRKEIDLKAVLSNQPDAASLHPLTEIQYFE
jgi:hypothetical protein